MASHNENRPLERIKKILDFIRDQIVLNPNKETFSFPLGEFASFDSLLANSDLLEISFKKISQDTKENVKIEFRQGPSSADTTSGEKTAEIFIWFYVTGNQKLLEYRNEIIKKLETESGTSKFILDSEGNFYVEGSDKRHLFKRNTSRYKLLHILARERRYMTVQELSGEIVTDEKGVRKKVDEIRDIVNKKLGLQRDSLFENKADGSGYRILNITLK